MSGYWVLTGARAYMDLWNGTEDTMATITISAQAAREAAAIERAYRDPHGLDGSAYVALDDALRGWWTDSMNAIYERWTCEEEECPGRPAWDHALLAEGRADLDVAVADVIALFRDRIADYAALFRERHPEAVQRRPME